MSSLQFFTIFGLNVGNTAHAMTTGGLIFGFKVAKDWMARQKENQLLMNLKISNELQLQKAQIHPDFLFQSLTNLQNKMRSGSAESPRIILKLSDLLSYLLYESNEELVPLARELEMIENLLLIENLNHTQNLSIQSKITADAGEKFIKPLILFPVLRGFFETVNGQGGGHSTICLEIASVAQNLHVSIDVRQTGEKAICGDWQEVFRNAQRKISQLYSDSHEFKVQVEDRRTTVEMNLTLANAN